MLLAENWGNRWKESNWDGKTSIFEEEDGYFRDAYTSIHVFRPGYRPAAGRRFLSCLFRTGDTKRLRKRPRPGAGSISQCAPRCRCGTTFPSVPRAAAGRRGEGAGRAKMADGVLSPGVNLEAFSQAIAAIQALRSSVTRVFDCLKDGMRNKETLEGREKGFVAAFQESLHSVSRDLG